MAIAISSHSSLPSMICTLLSQLVPFCWTLPKRVSVGLMIYHHVPQPALPQKAPLHDKSCHLLPP